MKESLIKIMQEEPLQIFMLNLLERLYDCQLRDQDVLYLIPFILIRHFLSLQDHEK